MTCEQYWHVFETTIYAVGCVLVLITAFLVGIQYGRVK